MRFVQTGDEYVDVYIDNRYVGLIWLPAVEMEFRHPFIEYVAITAKVEGVSYCFDPRYDTWEVVESTAAHADTPRSPRPHPAICASDVLKRDMSRSSYAHLMRWKNSHATYGKISTYGSSRGRSGRQRPN